MGGQIWKVNPAIADESGGVRPKLLVRSRPDELSFQLDLLGLNWPVRDFVASVLALTIAPALEMTPLPTLDDFPMRTTDLIRYGDTDRQGHVNNAVFATFLETGRVAFLFDRNSSILPEGTMLVIARLVIDFRSELNWPGKVEIGTRVEGISNRSFTLSQALFHNGKCAATSESTIVLIDESTRRSTPLTEELVNALAQWRKS